MSRVQQTLKLVSTRAMALGAVAACALLAGCGGTSDDQAVRDAVNHFTVDIGQGHYAAACKLAIGQQRSVICALATAGGPLSAAQCSQVGPGSEAGQACASSQAITAKLSTFTSLTISKVVISGSTATVAFNGSSEVMSLDKQNGKWLIGSA